MERGMNERVRKLRKQSMEAVPHIDIERAKLITEAYKNTKEAFLYLSLEL